MTNRIAVVLVNDGLIARSTWVNRAINSDTGESLTHRLDTENYICLIEDPSEPSYTFYVRADTLENAAAIVNQALASK